jgi:hypothetical protein
MYTTKRTVADTSYAEALNELRAAVPSLHAIAHCADAAEPEVVIYTTPWCTYCRSATALLR